MTISRSRALPRSFTAPAITLRLPVLLLQTYSHQRSVAKARSKERRRNDIHTLTNEGKGRLHLRPAHLSSRPPPGPPRPFLFSAQPAKPYPRSVSRRKVRTAGVALPSWWSVLFPPTGLPDTPPQRFNLRGPDKKVVARSPLPTAAPPALDRGGPTRPLG